jgi:hypothetical protein
MKIEIVLKDPRYCDGCPFLLIDSGGAEECSLKLWDYNGTTWTYSRGDAERPRKCREKYGD